MGQRDRKSRAADVGVVPHETPGAKGDKVRPARFRPLLKPLGLAALTVGLLALAYAPIGQFYLAWVGLAPWLVLVGQARSKRAVFCWSWLTGYGFFVSNMWWLGAISLPGLLALMLYMGIWFPFVGLTLWGSGVLRPPGAKAEGGRTKDESESAKTLPPSPLSFFLLHPSSLIFLIPTVWVAAEWLWGNLMTGLPWLFAGHSQTPVLAMCQIADLTGVYGVSFWVVLVNAFVALLVLNRYDLRRLAVAGVVTALVAGGVLAYGLFRMNEMTQYPGPRVMVVQPNYPQDPSGKKGASYEELLAFHLNTTRRAVAAMAPDARPDLIAWSETMMPPINPEYRAALGASTSADARAYARFLAYTHDQLSRLAADAGATLAFGLGTFVPADRAHYNSVTAFAPAGELLPLRYDKIHLVPFGEFMPFKESFPPLYRFFKQFDPNESEYEATPGRSLTVFPLTDRDGRRYRFATPICFEDVDSRLIASMVRDDGGGGGSPTGKRVDFLVNATNDGWFETAQLHQHLQLAMFRAIENRVPVARSVNTGISGFIDSAGRAFDLLPPHAEGTAVATMNLDRRVTFYTRHGDAFAGVCLTVSAGLLALALWNGIKNRRAKRR